MGPMKIKESGSYRVFKVFNAIILTLISVAMLYPFLYLVAQSFSSTQAIVAGQVGLIPKDFNISTYKYVITDGKFIPYYGNTIVYSIIGTVCALLFSALLAYPLSKAELYGGKAINKFIIVTMYFSGGMIPNYILMVSLDNLNFEFHPGPTLLYTAMIENGIDFEYYSDFTPSQARLIEAIDQERLALCRAYGVKVRDVAQTFHDEYGYEGTLYEMIKHADVYKGIKGPSALNSRFLTEDIPYSLRAIQTLAQIANISTPAIDTVVNLAYILLGDDLDDGRTLSQLGFNSSTTVSDLLELCR